jgi:hypothetical protein
MNIHVKIHLHASIATLYSTEIGYFYNRTIAIYIHDVHAHAVCLLNLSLSRSLHPLP